MSQEVEKYLELQKALVDAEKKRLGLVRDEQVQVRKQLVALKPLFCGVSCSSGRRAQRVAFEGRRVLNRVGIVLFRWYGRLIG